jgi:hypothetical protein
MPVEKLLNLTLQRSLQHLPGTGSGKGFSDALTDAGSGTRHQSSLTIETNHWGTL